MKKIIRIPIAIILLLGGAFLYVVQTPTSPFSQKVLTTLGMSTTSTDATTIDLTNCISYFDGCNNCSVENGKVSACTLMYCETPGEPKCNEYATTGTTTQVDLNTCASYFDGCNICSVKDGQPDACTEMYCETPSEPKCLVFASGTESTSIANPASVNCTDKGGTLNIVTQADGSQVGMCTLANGDICEERAYMRGKCGTPSPAQGQTSPGNPAEEEATMCTMQYDPVCASVAVQCIKAPCPPVEQTFGNACMMNANKLATFLHKGECETK